MSLQLVANHLAQKGRGPDSNLVHMSNREVAGLQALAKRHGGSLSVNPDTGLPEAGFLDSILPTIAGAGLTYFSGGAITPMMAAGIVGGISALDSKDLSKGLMAGLGAYGGAGLTEGLMGVGASELGREAAASQTLAEQTANAGAGRGAYIPDDAIARAATPSNFDKLGAGAGQLFSNPGQTMTAIGGGSGYKAAGILGAAAAPMLADEMVETTTEAPEQSRGMIRPYTYSRQQAYPTQDYQGNIGSRERRYFNEGYTAGDPYAAANGGLVALAGGGDMRRRRGYEQQSLFTPTTPLPVNNMYGASRDAYDYLMGVNPSSGQPYDPNRPFPPGMRGEIPENGMQPNPNTPKTGKGRYEFDPVTKQYKWVPDPITPVDVAAPVFEAPERGGGGGNRGGGDEGTPGEGFNPTSEGAYNVSRFGQKVSSISPFVGGVIGSYGDYLARNVNPNYSNEGRNYPAPDFGLSPSDNDDSVGRGGYFGLSRSDNDDSVGRGDFSADYSTGDTVNYSLNPYSAEKPISPNDFSLGDNPQSIANKDYSGITVSPYQSLGTLNEATSFPGAFGSYSPSEDAGIAALNAAYANYSPSELAGTSALDSSYANYSPSELAGVSMTAPEADKNISYSDLDLARIDRQDALTSLSIAKERDSLSVPKYEAQLNDANNRIAALSEDPKQGAYSAYPTLESFLPETSEATQTTDPYAANIAAMTAETRDRINAMMEAERAADAAAQAAAQTAEANAAMATQDALEREQSNRLQALDAFNNISLGTSTMPTGTDLTGTSSSLLGTGVSTPNGPDISSPQGVGAAPSDGGAPPSGGEGGGGNQGGGAERGDPDAGRSDSDRDRGDARGGYLQHGRFDQRMAHGGIAALHQYNLGSYSDGGRLLKGPGDGVSDDIPATIGRGQPARLADGEFVIPARIVSELGNGSTDAGARELYKMMDRIQAGRRKTVGKDQVAKNSKSVRHLPA